MSTERSMAALYGTLSNSKKVIGDISLVLTRGNKIIYIVYN